MVPPPAKLSILPTSVISNLKLWSLATQGRILVALLLTCELMFITLLAWLAFQTEIEGQKVEQARLITSRANRLSLVVYDTGDALGRYSRYLEGDQKELSDSEEEVPTLISWLKEALKNNEVAEEILTRIDKNISQCLPVLIKLQQHSQSVNAQDKSYWDEQRRSIQPNVSALLKDVPALIAECKKMETESPDNQGHYRDLSRNVLIVGLIVNIIATLAVTCLFFGRITNRLDTIADNIERFAEGKALNEPLNGEDELAMVDEVFHETASALRKQLKILQANEQRVRTLIMNLPIGLLLLNAEGNIEFANTSAEQLFMYSCAELTGKNLSSLLSGAPKTLAEALSASEIEANEIKKVTNKNRIFELNALKRNRTESPIDFRIATIEINGGAKTLAMILDATERFKLQQIRQNFVSMVRSELKQPLGRIADFLSLFSSQTYGPVAEKAMSTTKTMQQNVARLILLLNDLFDLDKLESGEIDIEPERCELSNILRRSIDAVAFYAQKHRVILTCSQADMPLVADSNRIVQVLVNLLSNAIKYSPEGGTVSLEVRRVPQHVEIGVIDQGRGIDPRDLAAIFEPYRQAEAGGVVNKAGTGLGLTISKKIVEAHNGQIGVQSQLGRGSVFWIRLPLPLEATR